MKPWVCIVTEFPRKSRWPGWARNFTATIAAMMIMARVAKMAMPPPRGMTDWLYLSSAGFETRLNFGARLLTIAVRMSESEKEPASNVIANMVSV